METPHHEPSHVYRSKVDSSGRVVLPAELRLRNHIQAGDDIVIIETDSGLRLKTQEQAIRDAQSLFADLAPADVILSKELIRDRRDDAKRE